MIPSPRVLHVGDAAFTAQQLVAEARRNGLPWSQLALAGAGQSFVGPLARARRAALGGAWLSTLAVRAHRHDIVHVHSATTLPHVRPVCRRFVLHCHGTDVRSTQYSPARSRAIHDGLRDAEAVVYSTPDLAEHVVPHRPDAVLLPVPISVEGVPLWQPTDRRPQVLFASRWEEVKGLAQQLETARLVVRALAGRAEVVGLDWGPARDEARATGVRLVPKRNHDSFLQLLAQSTAVIGQSAGILSASELEALASGAPLAVPTPLNLYAESSPPVLGDDPSSVVDAVLDIVADPTSHDPRTSRAWVMEWHSAARGVRSLSAIYDRVLEGRA